MKLTTGRDRVTGNRKIVASRHQILADELSSALTLLGAIAEGERGADAVLSEYFRRQSELPAHRRGRLIARIDSILAHRAALDWHIRSFADGQRTSNRLRLLAYLILIEKIAPDSLARVAERGGSFAPLSSREKNLLSDLVDRRLWNDEMPGAVQGAYPAWLETELSRSLGDEMLDEMRALAMPSPLDLRVNLLKASVAEVLQELQAQGMDAQSARFAPTGLRLGRRIDLGALAALVEGRVEPQDEGSQLAALLVEAMPGEYVVDFCAGAGGKTLALAAAMHNRGRLIALDRNEARLTRARQRLKRAGVSLAECRVSDDRKWLKRQAGRVDRVLVDAPCSGIGSWRRIPDARWRLRDKDIAELVPLQAEILDDAARLVRPGGRLIYVTCSVLKSENEEQISAFLDRHPDFKIVPVAEAWTRVANGPCPTTKPWLQMTALRHGTGGFFVAIMEREAAKVLTTG